MSTKLPAPPDYGPAEPAWPPEYDTYGQFQDDGLGGSGSGLNVKRYLAVLWRFKWLIALVTILGTAAGVGATRLMPPEYETQATIWIESGGPSAGPIQPAQVLGARAYLDLMRSYRVMDSVAIALKLYLNADRADSAALAGLGLKQQFVPGEYRLSVDQNGGAYTLEMAGQVVERGEPGDSIGLERGLAWAPPAKELSPGRRIEFEVGSPRDASNRLLSTLDAWMDQDGKFLRLRLRGNDPQRVAAVLNLAAERFVEVAGELKSAKLREMATILNDQLQYALRNLQSAEASLESYRVETITLPSEQASPVNPGLAMTNSPAFANFFALQGELDQLRRDRSDIERILAGASESGLAVETLELVPAVAKAADLRSAVGLLITKRAELRALTLTLTERHPLVQKAQEEIVELEQQTIPRLARRLLIGDMAARERELERLIASAGSQLTEIPPRAIEEARREREVNIRAQLFTTLQANQENARLAAVSTVPDVQILDSAVAPRRPVNQEKAMRLILMAFMGSLGLGVAGVIALDQFDPKLKYPEQVSRDLGLPILGTVPHVRSREGRGVLGNTSQVVESFRLIRLNLNHAYGTAGPVVIAITSPAGEEGKSFVTANLGLAFADLGRRTLVIDGDVRRGHLHHLLGGSRKPGLTDFLMGRINRSQLVRPTAYRNLDRIGSGTRRQDGPELLQSPLMAAALAELRALYDVILVDTPPIGAGADALALGTLTGNILIVLRTGSTDREMTETKLDMLQRLPVRLLGAVLNDVPESGAYGAYYHAYSYLPGYEATDEEESPEEIALLESAAESPVAGDEGPDLGSAAPHDEEADPSNPAPDPTLDELGMTIATAAAEADGDGPALALDPQRELHREHQRRSQVRQWK